MSAEYPFPGYHQQQNALPQAKLDFPRLAEPPSQVMQTNIRRLHDGWDFFKERGYGFPRFKKYGQMKSLLFPQFNKSPIVGNALKLPKLGAVTTNFHRPIPEGFKVKQVRVVRKAIGWFASVSIASPVSVPEFLPFGRALGVDVGLDDYIATSDGFRESRPRFLVDLHRKLKLLQRRLSRKQKRSKNYEKARRQVERLHNHIAFVRKDYQYKLAHKICEMGDSIFMEDIDFRIMAKGIPSTSLRGQLGKHTLDAGFGQFRSILKWVAWTRGKFFAVVDHKGSSKECPNCGAEWSNDLKIRHHICNQCGYEGNRDVASAQVICNRGIESTQGLLGNGNGLLGVGLPGAQA
jgi:putative transposase